MNNMFRFGVPQLMALALVSILTTSVQAQVNKKLIKTARTTYTVIDSIIGHYVQQGNFGGVVTVAEKNKTTYNKAFGLANMGLNIKNDTSTRFEIGSMSKQFCAAIVLMAVSEGKISLDSQLHKYLPYTENSHLSSITIHQLLAMRSAIPSYDNFPNFITTVARKNYKSHEEFILDQCMYPLQTTPGTVFNYSDGNYFILGAILETLYGTTYDQILKDKIFTPLKMFDSGLLTKSGEPNGGDIIKNLNEGYQPVNCTYDPETELPITTHYEHGSWANMSGVAYSSGAIYMTGSDFIKWTVALNNNTLFSEKYKKMMFTSYSDTGVLDSYYPQKINCKPTGYGYAMVIVNRPPLPGSQEQIQIYTHGGLAPGYSSVGAMVDGHDITIFITSNISSDAPLVMCWQIMNTLLGIEPNYGSIP